jgi:hypothetical protein
MKKIFLVVLIVLFGCASIPQEQYDMLQGTWMREDGATITFNGRNWETVDMTNGGAGYGTFEIRKDNRIQFTHTYIQNLKFPISDYLSVPGWRTSSGPEGNERIKEFQIRALEEFNRLYPERVLQRDPEKYTPENNYSTYGEPISSTGGAPRDYILEGNSLTLIQNYRSAQPVRSYDPSFFEEPFNGVFIRQ